MITFRKVIMSDAEDLLRWKNEPDTRANSIVTDAIIELEGHLMWLEKTLADKTVEFYIIQLNGESIGDLRLNHGKKETEVSIRMDKRFRGKGLATHVIGLIEPGKVLVAKIRAHNLASMRVFYSNGFRPERAYRLNGEIVTAGPVDYYVFKKYS